MKITGNAHDPDFLKSASEEIAKDAITQELVEVPDGCSGGTKWVAKEPEEPKRFCKIAYMVGDQAQECGGEIVKQSQFHQTGPTMIGGITDGYHTYHGECEKCHVLSKW